MKAIVLSFILLALIIPAYAQKQTFPENVGDIPFDSLQDDPSFVVFNPRIVFQ